MLKEIKYSIFCLIILLFIFFSIKFYISDENKRKTFRNLSSVDININSNEMKLPVILNDTNDIIMYLTNDNKSNKKKYTFWNLLNSED